MRIIRGKYQRRQIQAPANLPVRPTTDMAKESLFNILENNLDFEEVEALDLFTGTGNIAFELASRGCISVLAIEQDKACVQFIKNTVSQLKMDNLTVLRMDVFKFLPGTRQQFDLIFADPPY
ncbi:MAG: RsmD family RNA methyltransferase, partial [Bacteroidales bacterium]|nr:RsmD family RNA methyltransferase [Bacteroidales bacterium]